MECYMGCKIIKAIPKTYGEYKLLKYGEDADFNFESSMSNNKEGYMVYYPAVNASSKDHISWSPKEVFEFAYRKLAPREMAYIVEESK